MTRIALLAVLLVGLAAPMTAQVVPVCVVYRTGDVLGGRLVQTVIEQLRQAPPADIAYSCDQKRGLVLRFMTRNVPRFEGGNNHTIYALTITVWGANGIEQFRNMEMGGLPTADFLASEVKRILSLTADEARKVREESPHR